MNQKEETYDHFPALKKLLKGAIGPDRALTLNQLTQLAGIPDRRTTEVLIETRMDDFGFVLVSGSSGYFRPVEPEHLNRYLSSLESRIKSISTRRRRVFNNALKEGFHAEEGRFMSAPVQAELF